MPPNRVKPLSMKSFFRSGPVVAIIGWLIWLWMALCGRTIRWQIEGSEAARQAWTASDGVIVTAWHSTILILPTGWTKLMRKWPTRRAPSAMMISLSKDGEPVARAIKHLGLEAIRGSSTHKRKNKDKGGARAVAAAIRLLKRGGAVCITPDGPNGPRQRAQAGPILLAQRSGAAILPYALASAPAKRLGTWDRFIIPFPFTRGGIVFGEPVTPTRDDDTETVRQKLEDSLNRATIRAEQLCRAPHMAPAETLIETAAE